MKIIVGGYYFFILLRHRYKQLVIKKNYFLLVLIAQLGFAQAPAIQWQKTFGGTLDESVNSIQQTSDGGYIVAGYTQ